MKIFYIANVRLPTEKAHGQAIMKMCEAFASQVVEVDLLVPRRINLIEKETFDFYDMEKSFEIRRLPCFDLTNYGRIGFFIQWVTFSYMAGIFALFHNADYYYGRDELSLLLISFFRKRVVWEAHTAKSNWLVKILLSRIQSLVVISRGLKSHFYNTAKIGLPIMVAPSAVDLATFDKVSLSKESLRKKLNLPPEHTLIAYIGKRQTMGEDKGVEELEKAYKLIKEKHDRKELMIVSEVIPKDVPSYMKAADILIMNYPNKEHYAKFMSPLKLFEYMASGNAIVVPDLPSIREVVDESVVAFFEPDDPKSLAFAVGYIIDKPSEAKERARKALELVKGYTWAERSKKVLEFMK